MFLILYVFFMDEDLCTSMRRDVIWTMLLFDNVHGFMCYMVVKILHSTTGAAVWYMDCTVFHIQFRLPFTRGLYVNNVVVFLTIVPNLV